MSKTLWWTMVWIIMAVAVIFLLTNCAPQEDPFGPHTWKGGPGPDSTYLSVADHGARQIGGAIGTGTTWLIYALLITALPWIFIVAIPGALAGKLEMKLEGAAILLVSGALWALDPTFRATGLVPWLVVLDIIPAICLLFWETESGKTVLFGIPAAIFTVVFSVKLLAAITAAITAAPLTCLAGVLILVGIIRLFHGREAKT